MHSEAKAEAFVGWEDGQKLLGRGVAQVSPDSPVLQGTLTSTAHTMSATQALYFASFVGGLGRQKRGDAEIEKFLSLK